MTFQKNETIAEEISAQVNQQCVRKQWGSGSDEDSSNDLPDRYQCMVDVLGEASKAHAVDTLWSETQPELQLQIDNWKECDQDGNKYVVFAYVFNLFCSIFSQTIHIKM